jgi:hypothetical protein
VIYQCNAKVTMQVQFLKTRTSFATDTRST